MVGIQLTDSKLQFATTKKMPPVMATPACCSVICHRLQACKWYKFPVQLWDAALCCVYCKLMSHEEWKEVDESNRCPPVPTVCACKKLETLLTSKPHCIYSNNNYNTIGIQPLPY